MAYELDQCYDFCVLPPDTPQDDYFKLSVESKNGKAVFRLPKLAFQKMPDIQNPSTLNCRVKSFTEDGSPVLTHVVGPYVYDLYKSTFDKGGTFECRVVSVPNNVAEEPFMVKDRFGIFYRLNEPEGLLAKGQVIRCKFSKLTPRYFSIQRIDEGAKLPYFSPEYLFDAVGMPGALRSFIRNYFFKLPELKSVVREIYAKQPRWVLNCARLILQHMSEWMVATKVQKRGRIYRTLLSYMREVVLFLLEGSSYLNAVPAEERRSLQAQFTEIVESLQPYDRMVQLVAEDNQDEFVEGLFDKLQKSGYLYHPAKQFAILMLIFRLQPDKVGYYLSRIFESIFSRNLDNWKREPFRSAFVEQFRIYVRLARREIDALPMAETREQKSRLETIITAIALQLILSGNNENDNRTLSLFYRYISLLRPLNTESLLSKSFLALMGARMQTRLNYDQLRQPMMMMTQATVMPSGDFMFHIPGGHRYTNGQIDVTISQDGVVIARTGDSPLACNVIPDNLMTWLKPQVILDGIQGLNGNKIRKLADHDHWWTSIETGLLEQKIALPQQIQDIAKPKRQAEIGDEVYIVIDSVENYFDSNPTFECHIEDTEYLDGTGILKRDMIIGYNLKQPSERAYRAEDGSQYGFLAKVLDIRQDGSYIFSLRDEVDRYLEDIIEFEQEYLAVITGSNERDYSAIARLGFGLFLEKDKEGTFKAGDIVRFRISQKGKQGNIRGYILNITTDPSDKFDKTEAFLNLMDGIHYASSGEETSHDKREELIRDIDELLLPEDIRELVEIIRFHAIAESDLIKAYDYLRFARLLALAIADNTLADKMSTHASLLTLHQYYAVNNRLDSERLEKLQHLTEGDPVLRMIYHRLQLVSWLDRPDHNSDIYASVCNPGSEIEGSIARLVLSYNMIHSENVPDNDIASNIKAKIMEKLNVNSETRRGKYYGSESKYLEFKTSIVYPATAPGEEMRENPAEQQFHILSRIAGMLNANGGRLYIGVNNDGYEVGMHDDFKYFERRRAVCGTHQFKISNVDSMCVFLENLIDYTFGPTIARKITVGPDEEAEKEVILINVEESLEPVYIDGHLFVRQSGQSTREYHGKVETDFVREREELRAERQHLLSIARNNDSEVKLTDTEAEEEPVEVPVQSAPDILVSQEKPSESGNILETSRWRPNILHYYEPGFTELAGYLYFTTDDKIIFSRQDLYKETGVDDCRLALAVPHELIDGYLVLGYEGEKAAKISIQEIMNKGENSDLSYFTDSKLMFASLAKKDDALICILSDGSGTLWRRGLMVSQIENSHSSGEPRRIHDTIVMGTIGWEIADESAISNISDCLDSNLATRRIGVTMKIRKNTPAYNGKMKELVDLCRENTI